MATLTEDMVTARARGADIKTLRKLNCWGACLSDVSLLQRMPNLEVIAFSVNQITQLADFTKCLRLNELYLRGNCIRDLNQIMYLQHLPLRHLLLKENPIEKSSLYRETVIKTLPQLNKLDDCEVTDEERENAQRLGKDLVHPELMGDPDCYSNQSRSPSPQQSEEYIPQAPREVESSGSHDTSPSPPLAEVYERRNSNYDEEMSSRRKSVYAEEPRRTIEEPRRMVEEPRRMVEEPRRLVEEPRRLVEEPRRVLEEPRRAVEDPRRISVYEERRNSSYITDDVSPVYSNSRPVVYDAGEDEDRNYHQVQETGSSLSRLSVVSSRSSRTRSSNILSSVLLLIKELDIVGLEVVQVAVASRIHEVNEGA